MTESKTERNPQDHSDWRVRMAELIAIHLDAEQFGVKAMYLLGSAKNAAAGPESDIDLLIHFQGTERQREALLCWLGGWSLCLDEWNRVRTGCHTGDMLDVHIITDVDIAAKSSYAIRIDAITDPARPLPLKTAKSARR